MKVVIEISEKDYLNFMLQYDNGILDEKTPSHRAKIAIANGTPIPKGHGRLIDADATAQEEHRKWGDSMCERFLESALGEAPTIIEADKEGAEEWR